MYWIDYIKVMDKNDFFRLLKCMGIVFSSELYNNLY